MKQTPSRGVNCTSFSASFYPIPSYLGAEIVQKCPPKSTEIAEIEAKKAKISTKELTYYRRGFNP